MRAYHKNNTARGRIFYERKDRADVTSRHEHRDLTPDKIREFATLRRVSLSLAVARLRPRSGKDFRGRASIASCFPLKNLQELFGLRDE